MLCKSHFVSALTVVFVNSKSLSSIKIEDTPVDDPSLKILVANNSDTLRLLKMSSCPHVSSDGKLFKQAWCFCYTISIIYIICNPYNIHVCTLIYYILYHRIVYIIYTICIIYYMYVYSTVLYIMCNNAISHRILHA